MQLLLARVVHTLDTARPYADAIMIDAGRIVAVGQRADLVRSAPDAEVLDLGDRAICPGFVDAHHHLSFRCTLSTGVDCTPAAAPSIDALCARLRAAASSAAPGEWILGWGFDELQLTDRRYPTCAELEDACPEHPVMLLHYSCHEAIASVRALALAGIDRSTPNPASGEIVRDRRGNPTGRLVETAYAPIERLCIPDRLARGTAEVLARLVDAQDELFRVGITHVADPTVQSEMAALYARARAEGVLRVGVTAMPLSDRGMLLTPWDRLGRGPRTGDGDDRLRTGPLKLLFDGGARCSLCATSAELVRLSLSGVLSSFRARRLDVLRTLLDTAPRREGGSWKTGTAFIAGAEAKRVVAEAVANGFSVAIHAMGNAAIDEAIAAIEGSRAAHRDRPPPRIEHATFSRLDQPRRMADAGICVVAQPAFVHLPALELIELPPSFRTLALRSLLDAGVRVAGSSDAPVATFDPLVAMRAATTRQKTSGKKLEPTERIEPSEALAMYTREAAYACGTLGSRGTIEPGKRADLVVLSRDPLAAGAALEGVSVERTLLGGEVVYDALAPHAR